MRRRNQPDQIFVANLIFRQKNQMIIDVSPTTGGFFFEAAAWRDINFATNNWLYSFLLRRLVKIDRSKEHPMIGDRQRRIF